MSVHAMNIFSLVLECSIQAVVLILVVLGVHRLFGRTMTSFCKWCLWSVVIARLLIPFSISTEFPLAEYLKDFPVIAHLLNKGGTVVGAVRDEMAYETPSDFIYQGGTFTFISPEQKRTEDTFGTFATTYVCVTFFLFILFIFRNKTLYRRVLEHSREPSEYLLKVLDECRYVAGVSRYVTLRISHMINTPTLVGSKYPVILLPGIMARSSSAKEIKFVFLHELVHVRNRDIFISNIMNFVRILHWFNPFVHLLYFIAKNAREILCDENVLLLTGKRMRISYGSAVLKVVERASSMFSPQFGIGMSNGKRFLRRRILSIRDFGLITISFRARAAGALLTGFILLYAFISFASAGTAVDEPVVNHIQGVEDTRSFFGQRYLPSALGHEIPYYSRRAEMAIKYGSEKKDSVNKRLY
jgi:beta-lactamase regulating signal transducer with metallopeptidase domain